jgi:hypothetical protein
MLINQLIYELKKRIESDPDYAYKHFTDEKGMPLEFNLDNMIIEPERVQFDIVDKTLIYDAIDKYVGTEVTIESGQEYYQDLEPQKYELGKPYYQQNCCEILIPIVDDGVDRRISDEAYKRLVDQLKHLEPCVDPSPKRMNIYAMEGHKVRLVTLDAGYPNEREQVQELMKIGDILTVKTTYPSGWSSSVTFEEFPNMKFNTVFFEDVEPQPIELTKRHPRFNWN